MGHTTISSTVHNEHERYAENQSLVLNNEYR